MDLPSVSSIGGGASAFFSVGPNNYAYQPYSTYRGHTFTNYGGQPEPAYGPHDMLEQCESTAKRIQERYADRYGAVGGSSQFGETRRGALYCRTGTWLEILDERTATREARDPNEVDTVRGSVTENTKYGALDFISVAIGLISIRGVEANRYLCMDGEGTLYSTPFSNFSAECVFLEEMMENYYNLYSSCVFGSRRRPWYVALRKTGRPRRGNNSRKRRKASHFLVVHYDDPHPKQNPFSLAELLIPSLKHQPPRANVFRKKPDSPVAPIRKPAAPVKRKKKKRRREQRLQREERQRRLRKQEIERLRAEELARRQTTPRPTPRPKPQRYSGAGLLMGPPPSTAAPRLSGAGLMMGRPPSTPSPTPRLSGAGLEIRPRRIT